MAIYKANIDTTAATIVYTVNERNIYGSGHNATLNNISPITDRGGFDEFVVYHRALNATEVSALYDLGCGDFDTSNSTARHPQIIAFSIMSYCLSQQRFRATSVSFWVLRAERNLSC